MKNKNLLLPILLGLTLLSACNKPAPAPVLSGLDAAKAALQNLLKTENVQFQPILNVIEDENSLITILKSNRETDSIYTTAEQLKSGLLLGVFSVNDKKKKQTATYKTVLTKNGNATFLKIIDVSNKTEETIAFASNDDLPIQPPHQPCGQLCDDFFKEFDCLIRPKLQEQANKTCKNVFWATICKLNNGACVSIHLVVKPTRPFCYIAADLSEISTLFLPRIVSTPAPN